MASDAYRRFADQPTSFTLRSLNKGVSHVVAMKAFDEHGGSPLSSVVEIVP
ncbi:hypothetical protein SAMN02800691_3091 [Luteibacter sp. UNCMF366Tsu5.1]|nr:hypothetical protein SAMN02800691_3091 [Luteibacter sp. UNCMF366Tsu5.1]